MPRRRQALFVRRCLPVVGDRHLDPTAAAQAAFNTVFAAAVFQVAYGPSFPGSGSDPDEFASHLADMQTAYLA